MAMWALHYVRVNVKLWPRLKVAVNPKPQTFTMA